MKRHSAFYLWRFGFLALLLMLSACTAFQKKFTGTDEANVGIFADNTVAMLNEADFGFTKDLTIYTRDYFTDEPEEKLFNQKRDDAQRVLNTMLRYSLKLVAIADIHDSAGDRIRAYTGYISELDDSILETLELDKDYYDDLIKEVSEQGKFMDALKKAQPIIDALGRYMDKALDELEDAADQLDGKIEKNIDHRHADLIRYQQALEGGKYDILLSMEQVYLTGQGDNEAYNRIKTGQTVIPKEMISDGKPDYLKRQEIIKYLLQYLDTLHRIGQEIQPDWERYRATHLELDELHNKLKLESRKTRLITLVWVRAHQKMAAGITSPAEWFDISEAPGALLKIGALAL